MAVYSAVVGTADKLIPLGYAQVTTGFAAVQNLPAVPTDAQMAIIQVEGGDIRFRDDNIGPTATVGMLVTKDNTIQYAGDLTTFRFIESLATVTAVNILYYKYGV